MSVHFDIQDVIIAGAGPGDPDLITVKLQKALASANVIIADRLVNPLILSDNANPNAQIILAGKQGYNDNSFNQEEVTALLVSNALAGHKVVRLKGGDVAFFSNVLDEIMALKAAGIGFEIIPGITAASGASAYTGIPLTARGFSQGVQFITFNPNSFYSPGRWKELAQSNDTLVFYMSTKNIADVAELLLRYSKKPATPLAVVEQATTEAQQVHLSTLQDCRSDFAGIVFSSPSLIIVGDVVQLYQEFNWFRPQGSASVFPQLLMR